MHITKFATINRLCFNKLGFKFIIKREMEMPRTYSLTNPLIIETIAMLTVETLACTVNNVKNKFSEESEKIK